MEYLRLRHRIRLGVFWGSSVGSVGYFSCAEVGYVEIDPSPYPAPSFNIVSSLHLVTCVYNNRREEGAK